MWATSQQPRTEKERRRGFTIVELLIVIVVIGILAAIVIVAYNGVTQQARVASITSDLDGAVKQLAIDQVSNSAYPATLAAANGGAGLKASPGTTYQYSVDNSANPQTFCITATNGTTSYFVTSTNNVATAGACPGQGANGVAAITNLATNPSAEVDGNNWYPQWYGANGGNGVTTLSNAAALFGANGYRKTWTTGGGGQDTGFTYHVPVTAGQSYTFSAYIRSSVVTNHMAYVIWLDASSNNVSTTSGSEVTIPANSWQRLSVSGTAPTGAVVAAFVWGPYPSSGTPLSVAGQTLDFDGVMITQGSTLYNYADGSSPNWVWNGTPNASTSTGPPL